MVKDNPKSPGESLKMKTLIVEDNANFRRILRDSLENLFPAMVIHEAAEGNEALERVDTFRPDMIFMDIRLPGENGLQLTQKIKTRYPDTKVVIMTSYDSPEYREAAVRCGANHFISKNSMNWQQIEALVKPLDKVG
jgi:DNA-binding NarL/FixJ family response regulator